MMERDPSPGAPLQGGVAWPAGGCNACGPDAPSVSSGEEVTLLVREGERVLRACLLHRWPGPVPV